MVLYDPILFTRYQENECSILYEHLVRYLRYQNIYRDVNVEFVCYITLGASAAPTTHLFCQQKRFEQCTSFTP